MNCEASGGCTRRVRVHSCLSQSAVGQSVPRASGSSCPGWGGRRSWTFQCIRTCSDTLVATPLLVGAWTHAVCSTTWVTRVSSTRCDTPSCPLPASGVSGAEGPSYGSHLRGWVGAKLDPAESAITSSFTRLENKRPIPMTALPPVAAVGIGGPSVSVRPTPDTAVY